MTMDMKKMHEFWEIVPQIMKKIPSPGILLVSGDGIKNKNIMTIGWLQIGFIWRSPVVNVLVRESRHSYKLLQEHDEFTINILPDLYNKEIAFCGNQSGGFCDKFSETGLQTKKASTVSALALKESEITLECKILYRHNINPDKLSDLILAKYYSGEDFHQIIAASVENFEF